MEDYDYRFTDRDLRENPSLVGLAITFLQAYGGDYDYLRYAQDFLRTNGDLTTAIARGVINCMRHDPQWATRLLRPSLVPVSQSRPMLRIVDRHYHERPPQILLKAVWHMRYIQSSWPTAFLAHYLDHNRSTLLYFPYTGQIACHPYAVCSARISCVEMVHETSRAICRRCIMIEEDRDAQRG
jgi:hypothetical protein